MPTHDSPHGDGSRRFELRAVSSALLLLCLTLAAAGQILISYSPEHSWIGIVAFAGSFVLLIVLVRSLEKGSLTRLEMQLFRAIADIFPSDPVGLILVVTGLASSLVATVYSQGREPSTRGWPSFGFWLTGVLALVVFIAREAARSRRAHEALRLSRLELAGVIGLTAGAFVLRFVRLADVPYPISGDEATVGLEGLRILTGSSNDMFRTGWSSQPYLSFLGPAMSMAQFGETLVGLRLFPVLAGTLTVPALYFLVRSMFSRTVAFLAATLLATMAFHLHFSRIAVNNVDATFLVCVGVGLLHALGSTRRRHWFVAAGLACGFSLYSFAGARVVFVIALLYVAYLLATDREVRRSWTRLLLFVVAVGVAVLPTAVHFLQNTNIAFGRFSQMGVFQTGWLGQEVARTGHSAVFLLGRQLLRSFSMFVSTPAIGGFYNSPKPLLDPLWSIAFLLGMMFSWIRLPDPRHALLNIWFWSVLAFGGALILPPPHAERFLLAAPAVAVFAAWGVWNVWSIIGRISGKKVQVAGAFATVSLLAFSSVSFYFREYTPRYYFTEVNGEVGTELGRYLARQPRVQHVYFTGLPRMWYGSFASTEFLSGGVPGEDFPAGTVPDIRGKSRPLVFVALPHLRPELEAIRRVYPGGKLLVVPRRPNLREPLFFVYRLD
jgi:4-amino-4-deoxy-L-arabinose transferase-like glycosyltransferase